MTTQINLKFQNNFRNIEISEEYKEILKLNEANSFSGVEDSKKFINELREKLKNIKI